MSDVLPKPAGSVAQWTNRYQHALMDTFGPPQRVLVRGDGPYVWDADGNRYLDLLGGIAVIETVFTIPGLGRLMVDSIFQRDYPVIQGCLLFVAMSYVIVNLIVDLLYPLFDPRVVAE